MGEVFCINCVNSRPDDECHIKKRNSHLSYDEGDQFHVYNALDKNVDNDCRDFKAVDIEETDDNRRKRENKRWFDTHQK